MEDKEKALSQAESLLWRIKGTMGEEGARAPDGEDLCTQIVGFLNHYIKILRENG
jgi:hypothetical protein